MRPSPQSSLRERGEGGARAARGLVERVVGERYRGDFPFRTNPAIGPLARADGQRQRARPGIDTRSRRRCARQQSMQDLAVAAQNPIAAMYSLPFQNNIYLPSLSTGPSEITEQSLF